ncbi:DUF6817 domain-containing protein [Streptomyces sp. WM6378]|uniref:DUF6817 domain-containing protein n=1 Tax=Streptomyces sp. WM6378 TaxID=1415557 RepID=UPI0007C839E2|nr:hypothetical protein [Streptomyces sp. WM6378]
MPPVDSSAENWPAVEEFLRARGAAETHHPGGTLLEHLIRVARLLGEWGAAPDLRAAGLCHAVYGTDGFGQALADTSERAHLVELIGERAEAWVHLYASCDRGVVYPRLGSGRPVLFRDRFTGRDHPLSEADARAFLEVTAANELDVLTHDAELADRHGPALYRLFTASRDLLSTAARDACVRTLGRYAPDAGPTIRITDTPHDQILAALAANGVPVEEGPVPRTGARGPITSTYLRAPDGNLIEISTYDEEDHPRQ